MPGLGRIATYMLPIYMSIHVCMCVCIYTHKYLYVYIHTHVYISIYCRFLDPAVAARFERALLEGNRTITEGVMFSEEDWSECASLADMSSADGEESDVSGPSKKDRDWLARHEELKRFHAQHGHYQVSWTD